MVNVPFQNQFSYSCNSPVGQKFCLSMPLNVGYFEFGGHFSGLREPSHLMFRVDEGFVDFDVKDAFVTRHESE